MANILKGLKSQPHLETINGKPIGKDWDEHEDELDRVLNGFIEIKHASRCTELIHPSGRPYRVCADDCPVKIKLTENKKRRELNVKDQLLKRKKIL